MMKNILSVKINREIYSKVHEIQNSRKEIENFS